MKNKLYKAGYRIIKAFGYAILVLLAAIFIIWAPVEIIVEEADISFFKSLKIVLVFYAAIIALYFLCNGLEKVYKKGKKLVEEEKVH